MKSQRALGNEQRYLLSLANPEWVPTDRRSLPCLTSLERRGLVQCESGRWRVTPVGLEHLRALEAAGFA